MMSHEEALTLVVAGGPVPLEASDHVGRCAPCRAELAALRAVEEGLRSARPALEPVAPPAPAAVVPLRRSQRWVQSAAAAALVLGLLGGFAAGRIAPAPAAGAAPAAESQTAAYAATDDSTFALLSAVQTVSAETPTDEELADYLESHWGG